jgi:hypothetical protein
MLRKRKNNTKHFLEDLFEEDFWKFGKSSINRFLAG